MFISLFDSSSVFTLYFKRLRIDLYSLFKKVLLYKSLFSHLKPVLDSDVDINLYIFYSLFLKVE